MSKKHPPHDKKRLIESLTPPRLGKALSALDLDAPIHGLLHALDPSSDLMANQAIEEALLKCASTWQHLSLLEAAARASCVILQLEGHEASARHFHQLHQGHAPTAPFPMLANILTRYILNDPALILDDGQPFDTEKELGPLATITALIAAFIVRRNLETLATLDLQSATQILAIAEIRVPDWAGRITRLVEEYERTTYKKKSVSGSSST